MSSYSIQVRSYYVYNKHNAIKLLQVINWKMNYKYFLTKSDEPDKPVWGLLNMCVLIRS